MLLYFHLSYSVFNIQSFLMFFIMCICIGFILCKMLRYIGCGSGLKWFLFKDKTLRWIHYTVYYTKEVECECHKMPMKACMILKERLSSAVLSRRIPIKELYFWIWLCNILMHISLNHFWLTANSQAKVLNSMRFLRSHDWDVSVESIKQSAPPPAAARLSLSYQLFSHPRISERLWILGLTAVWHYPPEETFPLLNPDSKFQPRLKVGPQHLSRIKTSVHECSERLLCPGLNLPWALRNVGKCHSEHDWACNEDRMHPCIPRRPPTVPTMVWPGRLIK